MLEEEPNINSYRISVPKLLCSDPKVKAKIVGFLGSLLSLYTPDPSFFFTRTHPLGAKLMPEVPKLLSSDPELKANVVEFLDLFCKCKHGFLNSCFRFTPQTRFFFAYTHHG